ncbi:BCCT family transporter [Ralstonia sp. SET104]|uniref:BCCT family transporter n=1 Tax=Ralstonia sp. SET104 TaxID=2448774 RepID=UPI000F57ABF3|nr:BCCT family transporter [Ralstonia sp. SET104]GCB05948.1 transporter [Ralstonia sp. SET104]
MPNSAAESPPSPATTPRTTLVPQVVVPALSVLVLLLVLCSVQPELADHVFGIAQRWVTGHFDWFYMLAVTGFLVFLVIVAASRFGDIRLGPDEAEPEFSFVSWTAMLFAAGMGIGLMYFGVGEPMQHYLQPPTATPQTAQAAREAMLTTFFHWGLHAWAVYGVMGLALAYFAFRYNLPLTMRSGLYPLLRERINGALGHGVDAFALIGTVAGIATTLGYGVLQLGAGLHQVGGWQTDSDAFRVALICVVVVLAGISAASGLGNGVRRLSELNLTLAFLLLAFVIVAGPTVFLLQAFSENVGNYISNLINLSFRTFTYTPANSADWFSGWTIQYWAWWVSWSPFVGMFIARISRGRTVRQFVIGVLIVPTMFNLLWMTAFGNSAIWLDSHVAMGKLAQTATNVDALLFRFFDFFPGTTALSWLAIVLIAVFFVTSADSGAFVIDTIASRGAVQSPVWQRLFWAAVLGATAAILMLAGGLKALQAMTLVAALPVAIIMVLLCYGLWHGMSADRAHYSRKLAPATSFWSGQHWRRRLAQMVHPATQADVRAFLAEHVRPAMNDVVAELAARGIQAHVSEVEDNVRLTIPDASYRDFVYGVRIVLKPLPAVTPRQAAEPQNMHIYEPITFFEDGREGYDIEYLRGEEIIADVLRHYERYRAQRADQRTRLLREAPGHT